MAGSADDMGGFVLVLVEKLKQFQNEIALIKREKETTFQEMEEALKQLESVKKQDDASKESIAILKTEITKLKLKEARDNPFFNLPNGDAMHKTMIAQEKAKFLGSILGGPRLGLSAQNDILGYSKKLAYSILQAQKILSTTNLNALVNTLKKP